MTPLDAPQKVTVVATFALTAAMPMKMVSSVRAQPCGRALRRSSQSGMGRVLGPKPV